MEDVRASMPESRFNSRKKAATEAVGILIFMVLFVRSLARVVQCGLSELLEQRQQQQQQQRRGNECRPFVWVVYSLS
jgi:hypothetical protein